MSGFMRQLWSGRVRFQNASKSLDQYYQKVSNVNRSRYDHRIDFKRVLLYPPTIDGNEDYAVSSANEANDLIVKMLRFKQHPETPVFPDEYSLTGRPRGRIYDKMPFKYTVEKGKVYSLCTCGYSNTQPFCDSTHKALWTPRAVKKVSKYRPIKYIATETKDVWFCNCKQSNNLPLCDGTHKTDEVQKGFCVKI